MIFIYAFIPFFHFQTQVQRMSADIAEMKIKVADVPDLKTLIHSVASDLAELKVMKSTEKVSS